MSHRKSATYYKDEFHNHLPSRTERLQTSPNLSSSASVQVTSIIQRGSTKDYLANRAGDCETSVDKQETRNNRVTYETRDNHSIFPARETYGITRQPFEPFNNKQEHDPYNNGNTSSPLLCTEKFISPTPPSDELGWSPQSNGPEAWTYSTAIGQDCASPANVQHEQVYGAGNSTQNTYIYSDPPFNHDNHTDYINQKSGVSFDIKRVYINHENSVNRETQNDCIKPKTSVDPNVENSSHAVILPSDKSAKPKDLLLKTALLGGVVSQGDLYSAVGTGATLQSVTSQCVSDIQTFVSNDVDSCWRMSGTNGYDRSRMTGSSTGGTGSNLSRHSDGHTSQGQSQPPGPGPEAMLVGHLGAAGVVGLHDAGSRSIVAGTAGAGPQSTLGSVFRPPHTAASDPARYGAAYTSGSSAPTVGPFSPLYATPHGQAGALSPYSAFYSQFPGYPPGTVLQGHLHPQIESYSAAHVLQSMGSQAAQSQVSRPSFGSPPAGAALAQYSVLGTTRTNTSPSSGKGFSRPGISTVRDLRTERDEIDSKAREQEIEMQRRFSTGFIKEEKSHHFSPPTGYAETSRASLSSALRESPNTKRDLSSGAPDFYKVPTGREGSLKHRLLRPSDSTPGSVSIGNPQHSAFTSTEEPSPKRTKPETVDIVSTIQSHVINRESNVAGLSIPGSAGDLHTHLQYPHHFMKGSVIQLANGSLKHVEDLETDDFINSAEVSNDLKIDSSTVVHIEENVGQGTAVLGFVVGEHKVQVTVEATLEHPFFVFGQGWSSCQPTRTIQRYGLECHKLTVGDVCISLTHNEVTVRAAEISKQQQQSGYTLFRPDLVSTVSDRQSSSRGSYGQGHRNVSEASGPVKEEHQFTIPTSQPAHTEAQEQKSP